MTTAPDVERWLAELGLQPDSSAEREGVRSWDLVLDGRVRRGVSMTLILDGTVGLVCWVHYAPPLADGLRRIYRQMLRWNDELPFVKFALGSEDRPVLSGDVPLAALNRSAVGLAVARLLTVCDLLYPDSAAWVDRIKKPVAGAGPAGVQLLERYAAELGDFS